MQVLPCFADTQGVRTSINTQATVATTTTRHTGFDTDSARSGDPIARDAESPNSDTTSAHESDPTARSAETRGRDTGPARGGDDVTRSADPIPDTTPDLGARSLQGRP